MKKTHVVDFAVDDWQTYPSPQKMALQAVRLRRPMLKVLRTMNAYSVTQRRLKLIEYQ